MESLSAPEIPAARGQSGARKNNVARIGTPSGNPRKNWRFDTPVAAGVRGGVPTTGVVDFPVTGQRGVIRPAFPVRRLPDSRGGYPPTPVHRSAAFLVPQEALPATRIGNLSRCSCGSLVRPQAGSSDRISRVGTNKPPEKKRICKKIREIGRKSSIRGSYG